MNRSILVAAAAAIALSSCKKEVEIVDEDNTEPTTLATLSDYNSKLLSYYSFDGNYTDQGTHQLDIINHGCSFTTDNQGNPNSAVLFDGASSFLEIPEINFGIIVDPVTVSFWAKVDDVAAQNPLYYSDDHPTGEFGIGVSCGGAIAGQTAVTVGNSGPIGQSGSVSKSTVENTVASGNWNHYTIVFERFDVIHVYLNGVLQSTNHVKNGTIVYGNSMAVLGKKGNLYFSGAIDQFKVWKAALPAAIVQEEYFSHL